MSKEEKKQIVNNVITNITLISHVLVLTANTVEKRDFKGQKGLQNDLELCAKLLERTKEKLNKHIDSIISE